MRVSFVLVDHAVQIELYSYVANKLVSAEKISGNVYVFQLLQ